MVAAIGSRGRWGSIADSALIASIIVAPLAGGSVHLAMLPVLGVLATVAFCATVLGRSHAGQRQHLSLLPLGLLFAALVTLLQAVPLPASLLAMISPRAHEVRTYVGALQGSAPLSYEPAATLRLAALFTIYAMIAHVAYERASNKRGFALVARALVMAAIASLGAAVFHRVVGAERMLLVLDSARPARALVTTFVNPNHGAGFMLLASLVAVGLAVGQRTRKQRVQYLAAAIVTASASMICLSRGGILALGFGFVVFVLMLTRNRDTTLEDRHSIMPALLGAAIALPLAILTWKYDALLREIMGGEEDSIGFEGKLNAMRDSAPLITDHWIFGIGRGAYGSVYSAYKTTAHQFTYTHPENLIVQLLTDWGVPLGALAIVAFASLVFRRLRQARNAAVLGAIVGVVALSLQNFVDFSLEIPGVAIPVAAILGATGLAVVKEKRFDLGHPTGVAFFAAPPALLLIATTAAMLAPDLNADLRTLAESAWSEEPGVMQRLEPIAADHPANAVVAARMAYAAETATPAEFKTALRWANRTMFLAPTYADGHMAAGRLLLRFGHRSQGFGQMRRAWALADDDLGEAMVQQIVQLARTPEEVLRAVPRRDEVMDEPDELELATAALILVEKHKIDWAKVLLESVGPIDSVPPDSLHRVASAGVAAKDLALAERALMRKREVHPSDGRSLATLLEVLVDKGDHTAARALIDEALANRDVDPRVFLRVRLDLALGAKDVSEARDVLADMQRRLPPTRQNQVFIAQTRSKIELQDNRPIAATHALDDAIRLSPGSTDLRVERAQLFLKLGKTENARYDLEAVLRASPNHPRAKALLDRLPVRGP